MQKEFWDKWAWRESNPRLLGSPSNLLITGASYPAIERQTLAKINIYPVLSLTITIIIKSLAQ